MIIEKVVIQNFKSLSSFELQLNEDLNIIVGNNETGKSTILEAIYLCLTGTFNGRKIENELSPYLFNKQCVAKYVESLRKGTPLEIPEILIELYFRNSSDLAKLRGTNNTKRENVPGIYLKIAFDEEYSPEYKRYIEVPEKVTTIPTEYFKPIWLPFSNNPLTKRSIPVTPTLIDTTTIRLQFGTDYYLQRIINDQLTAKERTELSLEYRKLKETFAEQASIRSINKKLQTEKGLVSEKELTVSIDISQKANWETSLTSYLDEIPFQYIGKGDQSILKMLLALERKGDTSDIILIEEPENHLSFSNMNLLISKITEKCVGKQLMIATHSAFVANKLGLEKLILIGDDIHTTRFNELHRDTQNYFKKLPGYDTLRFILSRKAILVEGPSDELFVQKAYRLSNNDKLPIEDGIDVISVRGLSFKRFLDISMILKNKVVVITDNDEDYQKEVVEKYADYSAMQNINICADQDNAFPSLEPQIVKCNDLKVLNRILGRKAAQKSELIDYMLKNKTECALRLFETDIAITIPQYILDGITK
jgi:predicted ATP-dependent endonuclease of OLD family